MEKLGNEGRAEQKTKTTNFHINVVLSSGMDRFMLEPCLETLSTLCGPWDCNQHPFRNPLADWRHGFSEFPSPVVAEFALVVNVFRVLPAA